MGKAGAAAAVLASERKARQLGMGRAVRVAASVLTSDPYTERDLVMPDVNTCTRQAAKKAYEMAGVGPEDLDLVEPHPRDRPRQRLRDPPPRARLVAPG